MADMTPSRLGAILVLTVVPLYVIVGIVFKDELGLDTTVGTVLLVGVLVASRLGSGCLFAQPWDASDREAAGSCR